jgi:quercetin dioxygenase-like cupin family protein
MRRAAAIIVLLLLATVTRAGGEGSIAILRPADKLEWAEDPDIKGARRARLMGHGTKPREHNVLMRRWPTGTSVAPHRHSGRGCDGVVVEGTVTVTIGCDKTEQLTPGSYFFIAGQTVHSFRCSSAEDCLLFMSEPNKTEPVNEGCPAPDARADPKSVPGER